MPNIYNLFKFLEKKKGTKTPLKVKFVYAPNELTDEDLNVEGYFDLSHTKITSLPDNLKAGGNLDLSYTKITSLPDNLQVGGTLYLIRTSITSIPNNLKVGDDLNLSYSEISSIPNNLQVGGSLFLDNTPFAKYTKEEIRKMIEDKGGYVKKDIYA